MDNSGKFKKGQIPWNKGLTKNDSRVAQYGKSGSLTKQKLSKAGELPIPWNKGLTKENDLRLKHVSDAITGIKRGSESIEKSRINAGRKIKEQYLNGERKWWGLDPKNKEIWDRVRKKFGSEDAVTSAFRANSKHKINKLETIVQEVLSVKFPNQWQFVGDGRVRIGTKFPDFIHCSQKIVILVNGVFWHTYPYQKKYENKNRDEIERIESMPYSKKGYSVIFLWEDCVIKTKNGKYIGTPDENYIVDNISKYGII